MGAVQKQLEDYGFNTQPPEGGCTQAMTAPMMAKSFNTQPPEGGCVIDKFKPFVGWIVSTHSHPKVAAMLM